jgi:hypothetical protein
VGSPMPRMTPLEPGGDDHSPTYPLKQIVDTAQPLREQPTEPWGNAGRSGPLARPVSHRAPRGRRDGRKSVATPPTAWPSNLPGTSTSWLGRIRRGGCHESPTRSTPLVPSANPLSGRRMSQNRKPYVTRAATGYHSTSAVRCFTGETVGTGAAPHTTEENVVYLRVRHRPIQPVVW